jgi:hypothetical protein
LQETERLIKDPGGYTLFDVGDRVVDAPCIMSMAACVSCCTEPIAALPATKSII